jgi:glycosyltransferase involved in cell wall biosynthesis
VISISAIICTHNPRPDYLRRVLDALKAQTLPKDQWELLLIDNASKEPLAKIYDLSWHPHARHICEDELGLTPARLRGIAEAEGGLFVFVDDDNILASDYLVHAAAIPVSYSHIGVFGAGILEPEFEEEPKPVVRQWLGMFEKRSVSRPIWTNNVADYFCTPWGAGLCVRRQFAVHYCQFVRKLQISNVLDRHGQNLFCGGDDLFSWLSVGNHAGFGIFPELRVRHLISPGRVRQDYLVRLAHGHSFSLAVLRYMVYGTKPRSETVLRRLRIIAHGLKKGWFSMRCKWAESRGMADATQFISRQQLQPLNILTSPLRWLEDHSQVRDSVMASIPRIEPVPEGSGNNG